MSIIQFLTSGGTATIGGDLAEDERKNLNSIIKIFGKNLNAIGISMQIPRTKIEILNSNYLLIAKDATNFHFVFTKNFGDNNLLYRDFSPYGALSLQMLIDKVKIEIGEVIWAFSLSHEFIKSESPNEIETIAKQYIGTIIQKVIEEKSESSNSEIIVPELSPFIKEFRKDYPIGTKTAFIMMQFSDKKSQTHEIITRTIKDICKKHEIVALRADDKEYTDDLFSNIRTYMHCADFGIAVFERILDENFNPNVSLEVGYMLGLNKKVCLLKDSTLKNLHTDLVGKLYKEFNSQKVSDTLPEQLEKWMQDKRISSIIEKI